MSVLRKLDDLLGQLTVPPVLLCGSAISLLGPNATSFLPSVDEALNAWLLFVAEYLDSQMGSVSYYDRTIASYARALAGTGRYSALRRGTKFEDFVSLVRDAGGNYETLLEAFFICDRSEFNLNHSAIAFLLRHRYVRAILTTNFDEGIENAFGGLHKIIVSDTDPITWPKVLDGTQLIKLHGDVGAKCFVANSASLLTLEAERAFSPLVQLLLSLA